MSEFTTVIEDMTRNENDKFILCDASDLERFKMSEFTTRFNQRKTWILLKQHEPFFRPDRIATCVEREFKDITRFSPAPTEHRIYPILDRYGCFLYTKTYHHLSLIKLVPDGILTILYERHLIVTNEYHLSHIVLNHEHNNSWKVYRPTRGLRPSTCEADRPCLPLNTLKVLPLNKSKYYEESVKSFAHENNIPTRIKI